MRHWFRQNLIDPFPVEEVTAIADDEVDPRDVDLTASDVRTIWWAVERLYRSGIQPAITICLRRHGQIVLHRSIGHTHGVTPGHLPAPDRRLARPESLFNLFSASKAITAMVMHWLDERGYLHVGDRIADYIPEFAQHGKDGITIRHVLHHKAGLPYLSDVTMDLDLLDQPDEIIRLLCEARPTAAPGRRLEYHSITGGFLFAEICRRATGRSIREILDEAFCTPLGLDTFNYGIDDTRLPEVAPNVLTGPPPRFPLSLLFERAFGMPFEAAIDTSNDPRFLRGIIPSANIVSTAEQTCRFFEMLRNDGQWNGTQVLDPRTVHRATAEQTWGEIDQILMMPLRYSLGFMLGSQNLGLYGFNTPNAFGHLGFTSIVTWADPDRAISCALLCNGKPVATLRNLWWLNIMTTISARCRPIH